MKEYKGSVA